MKKINLVIVVIYFLLAVYYAIFNWSEFVAENTIDVGFNIIKLPIVAAIVIVGLSLLIFQWLVAMITDLSNAKKITQKDEELISTKAAFYDSDENRLQKISDSIEQLFVRIDEISRQLLIERNVVKNSPSKESDNEKVEP